MSEIYPPHPSGAPVLKRCSEEGNSLFATIPCPLFPTMFENQVLEDRDPIEDL